MSANTDGTVFDTAKQTAFLRAYAQCGVVTAAAKVAGCSRSAHPKWLRRDPTYRERFLEAKREAADGLELEARRRALEGIRRVVVQKGSAVFVSVDAAGNIVEDGDPKAVAKQPLVEHIFSDRLLEILLKGHIPHRYRERREVTHKGDLAVRLESKDQKLARVQEALALVRARGVSSMPVPSEN